MPVVSITGATGFIGGHLCDAFRNQGWRVRAIVRPGNQKPVPPDVDTIAVRLISADAALAEALSGSDLVVHAAGLVRARRQREFDAVNVDGTRAVVSAVNTVGARLIVISSQAASGPGTAAHPSREADVPRPLTAYGRSKLAGEQIVREEARTAWTIIRPSSVYGPRDRAFLPLFKLAARGLFVHAPPRDLPVTVVHVGDLAHGVITAAANPHARNETFFLGHPRPVTPDELLRHLADTFGQRYRPHDVPTPLLRMIAASGELAWRLGFTPLLDRSRLTEFQAEGFVCAVDRARDLLGFTAATPLRAGLETTARWYRDHGWI